MATPIPSQTRSRAISATWPIEVSHFMLELLLQHHKSSRSGDNGLRKDQWQAISVVILEKHGRAYEWEQCRNHYRVWKSRMRALSDLQKNSGMGWNATEQRFDAPQANWNDFKKKEIRYWQHHPVQPLHIEVAIWLGNEIATGTDSVCPSDVHIEDHVDSSMHEHDSINLDSSIGEGDGAAEASAPSPSCGQSRPCGAATSGREKWKKGGVDKIVSPLHELVAAVRDLVKEGQDTYPDSIMAAVDAIPGLSLYEQFQAKKLFFQNKHLGRIFLGATDENKPEILTMCMNEGANFPPPH